MCLQFGLCSHFPLHHPPQRKLGVDVVMKTKEVKLWVAIQLLGNVCNVSSGRILPYACDHMDVFFKMVKQHLSKISLW